MIIKFNIKYDAYVMATHETSLLFINGLAMAPQIQYKLEQNMYDGVKICLMQPLKEDDIVLLYSHSNVFTFVMKGGGLCDVTDSSEEDDDFEEDNIE